MYNVFICHDLLRDNNRKISPRCLMKIDLRKAYYMIRCEFLEKLLRGYGFPERFRQLIMLCVTTVYFSVKVNGDSCDYFEGRRGLI